MTQTALETFSVTRHANDPRADGAKRIVHVSQKTVIVERTVDGVRMRIAVPTSAYRDLVLEARLTSGQATLRLCHLDRDLEIILAQGDGIEVAKRAKAWSEALGKTVRIEDASVKVGTAFKRHRARLKATRRPSFGRRRKPGVADRLGVSFAGEREIIART